MGRAQHTNQLPIHILYHISCYHRRRVVSLFHGCYRHGHPNELSAFRSAHPIYLRSIQRAPFTPTLPNPHQSIQKIQRQTRITKPVKSSRRTSSLVPQFVVTDWR